MNYSHYYNWYFQPYRQQYKPVTAYKLSVPVNVNGTNINMPPYPAINYQPEGAQYPYVYVPIAQFSKVGATVNWDETTQTLNVTTDYFTLKQSQQSQQTGLSPDAKLSIVQTALAAAKLAYKEVSSKIPVSEPIEGKVRFNGSFDGKVVFDSDWWYGSATNLTVGKYYSATYDAAAGSEYIIITNDTGHEVNFRKSSIEASLSG